MLFGTVQVYNVPAGTKSVKAPSTGVTANVDPVQIVVFTLATDIVGLTTTVTLLSAEHPFAVMVYTYVTERGPLVEFVNI